MKIKYVPLLFLMTCLNACTKTPEEHVQNYRKTNSAESLSWIVSNKLVAGDTFEKVVNQLGYGKEKVGKAFEEFYKNAEEWILENNGADGVKRTDRFVFYATDEAYDIILQFRDDVLINH